MQKNVAKKKCNIKLAYYWVVLSWLTTALLSLPAILCLHSFNPQPMQFFCNHFDLLGFFAMLFGAVILMPLFFTIFMIQHLAKKFYPNFTVFIMASHCASILTALLSVILFIVPMTTMNLPYLAIHLMTHETLKNVAELILIPLWLAPAGMLYMLALFMIQFGLLPKTINQGYKPLLMYIISGGLVAFVFGVAALLIGSHSQWPLFIPESLNLYINEPSSILKAVLNPYTALLLDFIAIIPMAFIFQKTILQKIKS